MINRKQALILGGIAGAVGCGVLMLLGLLGIAFVGWGSFEDQAEQAIRENGVVRQHLGEIERVEPDLVATGDAPGMNVFVFRVEGTRGSGVGTGEFVTLDADTEELRSGTLQLPSGQTYDLLPLDPALAGDESDR